MNTSGCKYQRSLSGEQRVSRVQKKNRTYSSFDRHLRTNNLAGVEQLQSRLKLLLFDQFQCYTNKSHNSIFFLTLLWLIASDLINLLVTRPLLDKTNASDFKVQSRLKL